MFKKILFLLIVVGVIVGGVLAYQQRLENLENSYRIVQTTVSYNRFYPETLRYDSPLREYELNSIKEALSHYTRNEKEKTISYKSAYAWPRSITGADYGSFSVIDSTRSKDYARLYRDGIPYLMDIKNPHVLVVWSYLADDGHIYYIGGEKARMLSGADIDGFVPLYSLQYRNSISYAKDANHVYLYDSIVPSVDPESVELLAHYYLQDANEIHYFDMKTHRILTGADRESFEVLPGENDYDARDSKHYYYQGKQIDVIDFNNRR